MRTKLLILRAGLAALLVFCLIAYLAGLLAIMATDAGRMLVKMNQHADTAGLGISAEEYPALALAVTDYLKGRSDSAQIEIIADREVIPAFSQRELLHLEDIRGLVRLANVLRYAALGLVFISLLVFLFIRKVSPDFLNRIKPQKALLIALWAMFGAAALLIAWGVIDFNSLFYAFHRVLFRNDLWLLDPSQDLLLRLMPSSFFISYGRDLIQSNALILLSLPLAAFALNTAKKEAL